MPKLDFNVPLKDENGEAVNQFKIDASKTKVSEDGRIIQSHAADADGNPQKEPIMLNKILSQLVNTAFPDEKELSYENRVSRGKLARKLADTTKGSLKNYSSEEVVTIKGLMVKGGATPLLAAQFEDIAEQRDYSDAPINSGYAAA